jgi:peptide/nickel transport system substrate-binding protein
VARIGVPEATLATPDAGLMQIAMLVSREGLTERGYDGRPRPRLAEQWTSSDGGRKWTFRLRDGITFHDGTRATAALVVEALREARSPANQAVTPGLADITDIAVAPGNAVEITLRRPSSFLLEDLDFPVVRRQPDGSAAATGPFRIAEASRGRIVLDRHPHYHGGAPELDQIVIQPHSTVRTAWASLMRGEIDVLWELSRDAAEFVASSDVALFSYLRHYVYVIGLNSRRPLFSTPVRRALNAAIDRESLIRSALKGRGLAASGPLWPHHWAFDSTLPGYAFDPSLAGATLDAAGHTLRPSADGRTSRFAFRCLLPENYLLLERVTLDVQKQLYDLGVDMQLEVVSVQEYDRRLRTGQFDAAMVEMISGPTYSRPYAFWYWGGQQTAYNVFGYRNATANRWWDALRAAPGDAEYRAAAGQLQRALLDDPPALFLAWGMRTRAVRRTLRIPAEPGRDPMVYLWRATRPAPPASEP